MLYFPNINPVAIQIGPIKIFWYGVMYGVSFLLAWFLATWRVKHLNFYHYNKEQISDLIFYGALGVVLGGRIGYTFFYNLPGFLHDPIIIFKTWQGGMSFHGGMIGVCIAIIIFCKRYKCSFAEVIDFVIPLVPTGLAAGRLGNFINGELWGRVTTVPWGMIFPTGGPLPRHPSELYEFMLEGVLLFCILWWYSSKPKPRFAVTALFLLCYGSIRFFVEFFRQPDPQLGFIAFGWLTMGQLLSLPMIIFGILFFCFRYTARQ